LALGDVDGDGDTDVLAAVPFGGPDRLYRNDGTGRFADVTGTRMTGLERGTSSVVLGDVDGDGDLDLLGANAAVPAGRVWLLRNDGSGDFSDQTTGWEETIYGASNALALGDVDGDGDLDLIRAHAYPGPGWPPRGGSQ